jgi:predicted dehydrogenase
MSAVPHLTTRRRFLRAAGAAAAAPLVLPASVFGADGRPAPSERITLGAIGVGGRGSADLGGFLGRSEVQVLAVCDVRKGQRDTAKAGVDKKYGDQGCASITDFREILDRKDVDVVMIGTPDHWHALISIEACRRGKDVFCEKPETLTVRQGQAMIDAVRRYGRVFSGGSQRVWEDYNTFHRWVRSGGLGDVQEVYVNVGGPSNHCPLTEQPVPPDLDWDLWLGPAPWAPFNAGRLNFRPWKDYSGGGMTDWGAHAFGGALFACNLHTTGPVEVLPPDGKEVKLLTYRFANGTRFFHGTGGYKFGGQLYFKGTKGEVPVEKGPKPPDIQIPNYKGRGGLIGDFLHCVRSRERPFRDIEVAHRTVTVCHIGNIAYWLKRPLKWDPDKEVFLGDEEANRWLDLPKREPWYL